MAELIPPKRGEFLTPNGLPTIRFMNYLEQLARQGNETTTIIETITGATELPVISAAENRILIGDPLTCDETGFTVDTDKLSVDMDES